MANTLTFMEVVHESENGAGCGYNAVYIGIKNKRLAGEASLQSGPSPTDDQTKKLVTDALLAMVK